MLEGGEEREGGETERERDGRKEMERERRELRGEKER